MREEPPALNRMDVENNALKRHDSPRQGSLRFYVERIARSVHELQVGRTTATPPNFLKYFLDLFCLK